MLDEDVVKEVRMMQITISCEPKEIASLVLELQGKPGEPVTTDAIRRTLLEQLEECGQHPASVRQIDS